MWLGCHFIIWNCSLVSFSVRIDKFVRQFSISCWAFSSVRNIFLTDFAPLSQSELWLNQVDDIILLLSVTYISVANNLTVIPLMISFGFILYLVFLKWIELDGTCRSITECSLFGYLLISSYPFHAACVWENWSSWWTVDYTRWCPVTRQSGMPLCTFCIHRLQAWVMFLELNVWTSM